MRLQMALAFSGFKLLRTGQGLKQTVTPLEIPVPGSGFKLFDLLTLNKTKQNTGPIQTY